MIKFPHGVCWGCANRLDTAYVFPYCSDRCWLDSGAPDAMGILRFKLYETFSRLGIQ